MKVDGKPMRTIWVESDGAACGIIDQTRLPHRFETVRLSTVEDAAHAACLDDAAAEALQKEWTQRETEVVAPYLVPLRDNGSPVQREHVREFVRANGPTTGPTRDALARAFARQDVFED